MKKVKNECHVKLTPKPNSTYIDDFYGFIPLEDMKHGRVRIPNAKRRKATNKNSKANRKYR